MEAKFWHERWNKNEIAFHNSNFHPLLQKYFHQLSLKKGSTVFVPLCGKTMDISYLLSNGFHVVAAELSELAITQLFEELRLETKVTTLEHHKHFKAKNIDVFVGDIFELSQNMLGKIDAIYDRAALVALPEPMRNQYAKKLLDLSQNAPQLIICYDYDQASMNGPPFSICDEEIQKLYSASYKTTLLESKEVPNGLKGECAALEKVWLLK